MFFFIHFALGMTNIVLRHEIISCRIDDLIIVLHDPSISGILLLLMNSFFFFWSLFSAKRPIANWSPYFLIITNSVNLDASENYWKVCSWKRNVSKKFLNNFKKVKDGILHLSSAAIISSECGSVIFFDETGSSAIVLLLFWIMNHESIFSLGNLFFGFSLYIFIY